MKLLLDENLPLDLRHFIPGHEVFTVPFLEWKGVTNGALLLRAAEQRFDAVLTMDAGIEYQHNPATLPVAVVILHAGSNQLDHLRPLLHALLRALDSLAPRTVTHIR